MHLSVAQPETSGTAPPRRLITASQTNSLAWVVYRELDDFLFEVSPLKVDANDPMPPALYTSPANFSTAHKAEKAAKSWCEAYEPSATPQVGQNLGDVVRRMEVSGWLIEVCAGERGGYVGVHIDLDNGEVGTDRPSTYETADAALDAARTWADANPTRAEQENRRASADMDAALAGPDMSTPFDGLGAITTELLIPPGLDASADLAKLESEDPAAAAVLAAAIAERDARSAEQPAVAGALPRDEEVEQLRRELALARKERDAAVAGAAADFLEVTAAADELMALAARKQKLLDDIEDLKLELKSVEKKLTGKGNTVASLVQSIGRSDRGRAYQQRLTFASSPETHEVVAAAAQKAVDKLQVRAAEKGLTLRATTGEEAQQLADGPSLATATWAYNGIEYIIELQTTTNASGPCVTAWIRDHRDGTEGFGETVDQALDACKNAAAIVFADLEPGEPPPAGPPATAKKSKGPKLKGHDQAAVLAAVARTDGTVAASIELGCSPFQLEKFAEKNGITLKLPEAPPAKTSKPRGGRKPKGGAK